MPKFIAENMEDKGKVCRYILEREDALTIIIKRYRADRSNKQNAYYWGVVIAMIADETLHTMDEVHDAMRVKFLMYDDERIRLQYPLSTTVLDTIQFEAYLAEIRQWAMEFLNMIIPLPNEEN